MDKNPGCWMQTPEGRLRPASGLCFGSRYLGEGDKRLLEILPSFSFSRVRNRADFWLAWLIDVCAEHVDHRQAIFVEDAEGWLDTHFVDFGHFFGGPKADSKKHFRASRYLDSRIYVEVSSPLSIQNDLRALDTDGLWERIEAIPSDWKQKSALGRVERCLQRLAERSLIQDVIETISDAVRGRVETDSGNPANERLPHCEVLRPGIQGAKFGRDIAHNLVCL
ncbi:MAG: hypothetical protein P4L87_19230 [Formivibrio sp.]|nr:hypothetical protein [Formivibrio sp.]